MRWLLPLGPIAELHHFQSSPIASQNHYATTVDSVGKVWPWRSYKTSAHTPPELQITHYKDDAQLAPGYVFLSPADLQKNDGTHERSGTGYVMTTDGDLIFAAEESRMDFCDYWIGGMTDFRVQVYDGKPHIVYWNGCNHRGGHWGHRWGRVTFVDEEYNNFTINPDLKVVTHDDATKGQIDIHEHEMTDRNTLLVTSYSATQVDLTPVGGTKDGWIYDCLFFELDVATQEVLFKWSALEHVPLQASMLTYELRNGKVGTEHHPWDWFHINSVQAVGSDFLISSRHSSSIYLINGHDGSVFRRVAGLRNGFSVQHHARAHNLSGDGMTISFFNNNNGRASHALALYLSASPHSEPQVVRRLHTPEDPVNALTMGSYQMDLGNGNGFVGYGRIPLVREYGPVPDGAVDAELLWEAQYGYIGAAQCYRTMKFPWRGTPKSWDPVVAFELIRSGDVERRAFVSWNGATDIEGWAVFTGDLDEEGEGKFKSVGVARKMGFETSFEIAKEVDCVQVGAIRDGVIIRRSNVACLSADESLEMDAELQPVPIPASSSSAAAPSLSPSTRPFDPATLAESETSADGETTPEEPDTGSQFHTPNWLTLFLGAAAGTILTAAATAAFFKLRDWRRRRAYAAYAPVGDADFDETELDEAESSRRPGSELFEKGLGDGRFAFGADDDEEEDGQGRMDGG